MYLLIIIIIKSEKYLTRLKYTQKVYERSRYENENLNVPSKLTAETKQPLKDNLSKSGDSLKTKFSFQNPNNTNFLLNTNINLEFYPHITNE